MTSEQPPSARPGGAPQVGARAERTRRIDAKDIRRFTEISGDRNPVHYDEAIARALRLREIIVQGITSATLNAVVAEELPGPGTVFLQVEWSFRAPVRPRDEITGAAEVLEVREDAPITKLRTVASRRGFPATIRPSSRASARSPGCGCPAGRRPARRGRGRAPAARRG